ncbi:MAG: hypothetical protein HGB33_09190 [Syntrophaceae bacterium]|nr:hypothetical protein [Syntrophaceae bacterium]
MICSILEEEEKGFSLGASEYLVKPFLHDDLANAIKRLNQEPFLHLKAFAVVIDGEIIYTGYFWAAFSSAICDWTNIDYLDYGNNLLCVKLGYPTDSYGSQDADQRNNEMILDLLDCDGKLKD